jgi:hypothetical protein
MLPSVLLTVYMLTSDIWKQSNNKETNPKTQREKKNGGRKLTWTISFSHTISRFSTLVRDVLAPSGMQSLERPSYFTADRSSTCTDTLRVWVATKQKCMCLSQWNQWPCPDNEASVSNFPWCSHKLEGTREPFFPTVYLNPTLGRIHR